MRHIIGSGEQHLLPSDHQKFVRIENTTGDMLLRPPPSSEITEGWRCELFKSDPSSNVVHIKPIGDGDTLNHFWSKADPYCLYLNVTQAAAELVYSGEGRFHLMGKSFHRDMPQSQRTIVTPIYNVLPKDRWETIRCNPSVGGQAIALYFNPVFHFTKGGYLSCNLWVEKVDNSGLPVVLVPFGGDAINGVTNATYSIPSRGRRSVYIASDGLWIH